MELIAGRIHPTETAKALLHTEATASRNYVHRGQHDAALVGHSAWVAGLSQHGSSQLQAGKCPVSKCT